jgi:mandelamide amidase
VTGFRPSVGRWSTQGILPISHTRDTPGPIARSVRDLVLLDAVVTGQEILAPRPDVQGLRIGVPSNYLDGLDPEVEALCRQAIEALARAGASIVLVNLPEIERLNAP